MASSQQLSRLPHSQQPQDLNPTNDAGVRRFPKSGFWMSPSSSQHMAIALLGGLKVRKRPRLFSPQQQGRQQLVTDMGFRLVTSKR